MHTEALAESIPCPEPACPHMATIIDHWSGRRPRARSNTSRPAAPTATSSPQTTDSLPAKLLQPATPVPAHALGA
jgi:hypothetical protein